MEPSKTYFQENHCRLVARERDPPQNHWISYQCPCISQRHHRGPGHFLLVLGRSECGFQIPPNVFRVLCCCGGLCPGLNNLIREIVKKLKQGTVSGIQGGFC